MKQSEICPICGKEYSVPPALSKEDNAAKICSECSIRQILDSIKLAKADQDEIMTIIHRSQREEATLETVRAKDVERAIWAILMGYEKLEDTILKDAAVNTFAEANVPTWDCGFFLKFPFGEEFHVTIIQTVI